MRKGFSVTLAMVAFAMLAYNASAYAPTIDDLPDIIIGDAENTSGANIFVYPDAIDLDVVGHDDATTVSQLIWTYSVSGAQPGPYVINKATASIPGTDNLVSPAAAKRIDNQFDPLDPTTVSLGARTITFRDVLRSPLNVNGGKGPYPSGSDGVTSSRTTAYIDSRVVTMYCSDGSTVSLDEAKSFVVFTFDNGYDRLSPRFKKVYEKDLRVDHNGWTYKQNGGTAPESFNATDGVCITVGSAGDNDGQWQSTYGTVDLVANCCWETRMTVSTTNTTPFKTPLWLMVYDNTGGPVDAPGQDEYGGEYFFLDNEGGADSPMAVGGRSNFTVYMMPIAMQTDQFLSSTNGFFTPFLDSRNNMRIILRVFDLGTTYGADSDAGAICWSKVEVYQHDLADMVVDQDNVMNVPTFTGGWSAKVVGDGASVNYGGGVASIVPTTNWDTGTIILFAPGDQTYTLNADPASDGGVTTFSDDFPITWVADSTYYVEFKLSAISAAAESTPPDVIRVGADTALTAELTYDNFYVPNTPDLSVASPASARGVGMPRFGTAQKYACFFTTHSVTKSGVKNVNRWRPRFEILTSSTLDPQGRETNPTGLNVNSMKVQKIHFSK